MAKKSSSVSVTPVEASEFPEFKKHKKVFRVSEPTLGLKGFISLHNTNLGPAIGGTRYWYYETEHDALRDALRLSRAMTYKCAMAGVPFGGGKTVLMAPKAGATKSDEYLIAYAEALEMLGESFYTGEDVGLTEHDVEVLEAHSDTIVGRPEFGGMPARWAALSVFYSMEASLEHVYGSPSFQGRSVAIRGLGGVGIELCAMLEKAGAHIVGADTNATRVSLAKKRHPPIHIIPAEEIHAQNVDIYAPSALGDEFDEKSIQELSTKIVCGAANNQLKTEGDGMRLYERGIVYVPDYVANAGGLVSVADELHEGGYSQPRVEEKIREIKSTVADILNVSAAEGRPTNVVADEIAEKRFMRA